MLEKSLFKTRKTHGLGRLEYFLSSESLCLFQILERIYGPTFIYNIQWQKAKEAIYNMMLRSSIILLLSWSLMYIDESRNAPMGLDHFFIAAHFSWQVLPLQKHCYKLYLLQTTVQS